MALDCSNTSEGFPPFVDAVDTYNGYEVSLYPASNSIPAGHAAQLLSASAAIVKRNSSGTADPAGKIVVLAISMSNGRQEYDEFIRQATDRGPHIVLVNGAQTGKDAAYMYSNIADYWTTVDARLSAKSVTAAQVGAIWLKQSIAGETGSFPTWTNTLKTYLKYIVQQCATKFPNAKIIFFSSRTYGGYATTGSPEPYAYESAFPVKWLIEDQIDGSDVDVAYGTVPVMTWGPYLWSDGTAGRTYDSLVWNCGDFEVDDGYHPAGDSDGVSPPDGAEYKVAIELVNFFTTNTYTVDWWYLVSPTLHTTLSDNTVQSSFATSSYTPTADIIQIVTVLSRGGAEPNQPTLTGHGLTYTAVNTRVFSSEATPRSRITVFRAVSSSPSTGTLTIDFGGQNQNVCLVACMEIAGIYNHANGVVQSVVNSSDSVSSLTITMGAQTTEDAMLAVFGNVVDSRMAPDTGWTEVTDFGNSGTTAGMHVQFIDAYDASAVSTKSGGGTMNYGGICIGLRRPPPNYLLEVTVSGSGTVTSSPSGINCGSDCEEEYVEGTSVTLTVAPALGWDLWAWSGDYDSVAGYNATVEMDAAKQITATLVESFGGTLVVRPRLNDRLKVKVSTI